MNFSPPTYGINVEPEENGQSISNPRDRRSIIEIDEEEKRSNGDSESER